MNINEIIKFKYKHAKPLNDYSVVDLGNEIKWLTADGKRPIKLTEIQNPTITPVDDSDDSTNNGTKVIEEFMRDEEMVEGVHYQIINKGLQIEFWNVKDADGNPVPKPTDEDLQAWYQEMTAPSRQLSLAADAKMAELDMACTDAILGRFAATIGGQEYFFSCDREAQANFSGAAWAFDKDKITSHPWTAHTARVGGDIVRLVLDKSTFEDVNAARLLHVATCVGKLRDILEPQVRNAVTIEEINAITW